MMMLMQMLARKKMGTKNGWKKKNETPDEDLLLVIRWSAA